MKRGLLLKARVTEKGERTLLHGGTIALYLLLEIRRSSSLSIASRLEPPQNLDNMKELYRDSSEVLQCGNEMQVKALIIQVDAHDTNSGMIE